MINIETFVISLSTQGDRRARTLMNLEGLKFNPALIRVVNAEYTASNGAVGCARSHANALCNFLLNSDADYCLVIEDDFECSDAKRFNNSINRLQQFERPWDVILLASNVAVPLEIYDGPDLYKVVNAQTTSSYLVRRKFAPELIKLFFDSAELLADSGGMLSNPTANYLFAIDMRWKELQPKSKFLAFLPQISFQRDAFSEIENRSVSYKV
jgi:glycosyl transferase family 25